MSHVSSKEVSSVTAHLSCHRCCVVVVIHPQRWCVCVFVCMGGPTYRGSPTTDTLVLPLKHDTFIKQGHIGAPPVPYRHTGCYQKHPDLPGAVSPTQTGAHSSRYEQIIPSAAGTKQSMTPPNVHSRLLFTAQKQKKKKVTYQSRKGTSKFNKVLFIIFFPHYMKRKNGYTPLKDRGKRGVSQ